MDKQERFLNLSKYFFWLENCFLKHFKTIHQELAELDDMDQFMNFKVEIQANRSSISQQDTIRNRRNSVSYKRVKQLREQKKIVLS